MKILILLLAFAGSVLPAFAGPPQKEKEYPVLFIVEKGSRFHGQSGFGYNVTLFEGKLIENKQGRKTALVCDGLLTPNSKLLRLRLEKPRHYKLQTREFGKEKIKEITCKE